MWKNQRSAQRALWAGKIICTWALLVASMALTASFIAQL
jgi:hypothetical protein